MALTELMYMLGEETGCDPELVAATLAFVTLYRRLTEENMESPEDDYDDYPDDEDDEDDDYNYCDDIEDVLAEWDDHTYPDPLSGGTDYHGIILPKGVDVPKKDDKAVKFPKSSEEEDDSGLWD